MALWSDRKPNNAEAGAGEGDPKPVETPTKSPAELIAESLKPLVEGFQTLRDDVNNRISQFEQANRRPEPAANTEVPSVWDDENAAFAAHVGPVMLRQYELEARMVRQDIRREYERQGFGDMWTQFESDINAQLDGSALVQPDGKGGVRPLRGDPDYIRNVVNMIIGRAAVKAGLRLDGNKKTFFLETAGGGTPGENAPDALEGLTADQARVVQRMGIDLKDGKTAWGKLKVIN